MASQKATDAGVFIPAHATLPVLQKAVQKCKACDLYLHATQAVPGDGPAEARLLLIGEQPGNEEDLAGKPFVGPAGRLTGLSSKPESEEPTFTSPMRSNISSLKNGANAAFTKSLRLARSARANRGRRPKFET